MSAAAPPRLSLRDVRRSFGKVVAVAGVDLDVRAGAVHALLGENGAGKSTLMNVVYGVTRADAGTISVDGELVQIGSSADAIDAGIAMVHQHHRLIPSLTVAEALVLASPRERWRLDLRSAARRTRILADELGLEVDPGARIQDLSLGARQRVEILTAVQRDARLLILDEPTAVLAPGEIDPLFALLRRMAASGRSIILITHRMGEVFAVSDTISVMRKGALVSTLETVAARPDQVLELVVTSGPLRPAAATAPKGQQTQVVLQVDGLLVAPSPGSTGLQQLSLSVGRGEIVGVAGVEGNGQHALVEVLAGVRKQDSGTVTVDGRLLDVKERRDVISVVPEDRHREGLVLDLSTSENLALPRLASFAKAGLLRRTSMRAVASEAIESYGIVTPSPNAPVRGMSGGNQQKVVLARALAGVPPVLVVSQPTRGLDPGATNAVLDRIRGAAAGGTAVLFISSDLDEVIEVSDRVAVMYRGAVSGITDDPLLTVPGSRV